MEIGALSEINQKFIKNQLTNKTQATSNEPAPIKPQEEEKKEENKPNNTKKILLALGGLAIAGMAAYALFKKGKTLSIEQFKESGAFDLGKAIFKGKPYTGKITVGPKDAQKVITYKKGKMVSALADGVLKQYNYDKTGKLDCISKIVNKEAVDMFDLNLLKIRVLQDKTKLNSVLENQEKYNFEQFYDKAVNNIQYKSRVDNDKINEILEYKDKIEYIANSRAVDEANAALKAKQAQDLYMAPFREKLAYNGLRRGQARKSAEAFTEMLDAQDKYNAPFEQKLSNKSAKESANVFIQKEIENARKAQDALISYMQKPSGKKASESAKVFIANS